MRAQNHSFSRHGANHFFSRRAVVRLYLRLAATRVKLRFSTSTKMSTQQTAFRTRRAVGALMIVFASFALLNGERHVRKVLKNKMENFQQTPFSLKTRLQLVAAAGRASSPPPTRRLQPPSMARRPHRAKFATIYRSPPIQAASSRATKQCKLKVYTIFVLDFYIFRTVTITENCKQAAAKLYLDKQSLSITATMDKSFNGQV